MSTFTRIFLYALTSAALATTCLAQGKAKRERPPKRVKEMVVIAPTTANPPETREVGRATLTYYPGQDDTFVSVTLPGVYRRGEVSADVVFEASYEGREFAKVEEAQGEVEWHFTSEWDIFKGVTPLTVTADGERFSFKVEPDSSIPGLRMGSMDFAFFKRLVNSKSARLSLGPVAFDLTEEQRETMRDLLKVFESPSKQ